MRLSTQIICILTATLSTLSFADGSSRKISCWNSTDKTAIRLETKADHSDLLIELGPKSTLPSAFGLNDGQEYQFIAQLQACDVPSALIPSANCLDPVSDGNSSFFLHGLTDNQYYPVPVGLLVFGLNAKTVAWAHGTAVQAKLQILSTAVSGPREVTQVFDFAFGVPGGNADCRITEQ